MRIAYTAEQERLRDELRAYYVDLLTPEVVAELAGSRSVGEPPRRVWRQMCADGWAGIGWPSEWGGQGRSSVEQFIFYDESMRAGAGPDADDQHRGSGNHALRTARNKRRIFSRESWPVRSTSVSDIRSRAPAPIWPR